MEKRTVLGLLIVASLIFISAMTIFAQEPTTPTVATPVTKNEPETQWVWGEVVNMDPQNKMILVKYLDYETDQEKKISITVDDKTTYENIKSIDEIKPLDALSIDYIVSPEGKNVAKNISLEKPENAPKAQPEATEESVPKEPQQQGATQESTPGDEEPSTPTTTY